MTHDADGILVLVRHGESEWNAKNIWTGLTDIGLSEKGREEARSVAHKIADIRFDIAFTSMLSRASETLRIILETLHVHDIPVNSNPALNERDYGVFTGKNKLEIKTRLGDVEYLRLRRGWDYPIEKGESLKQVYERVVPYYDTSIAPFIREGKHVLVVAHGNSLRALIKKMEHISDYDIPNVELTTGQILLYRIDASGAVVSKEER